MADSKVTGLNQLTNPAPLDFLYAIDDPTGSPISRYATVQDVVNGAFSSTNTMTGPLYFLNGDTQATGRSGNFRFETLSMLDGAGYQVPALVLNEHNNTPFYFCVDDTNYFAFIGVLDGTSAEVWDGWIGEWDTGFRGDFYPDYYAFTTEGQFRLHGRDATSPAIQFDSGDYLVFYRSSNYWAFFINNTEGPGLDATGFWAGNIWADSQIVVANIGLTTDGQFYLSSRASTQPVINFDSNDYLYYDRTANGLYLDIGSSQKLAIRSDYTWIDSTVGIIFNNSQLTTQNYFRFDSGGTTLPRIQMDNGDFWSYDRSSNAHFWRINNTTELYLTANGTRFHNSSSDTPHSSTTTNYSGVAVNGAHYFTAARNAASLWLNATTGSTTSCQVANFRHLNVGSGAIVVLNGTTTFAPSSDYRMKSNVEPADLEDGEAILDMMEPKWFDINISAVERKHRMLGFLAHEAQLWAPEAVNGEKDAVDENGEPVYQGLDYGRITPYLTVGVLWLKQEKEKTNHRVVALEGQVNDLLARVAALEAA